MSITNPAHQLTPMTFPSSGIYAITQTSDKTAEQIIYEVDLALKAGVSVLQYRDKQTDTPLYLAGALKELCLSYNIPLIINDNLILAKKIGAQGVHIGKDDGQISYARTYLGKHAIIGVSCYDSIDLALAAEQQSADYIAFGRFFPSSSKPLAEQAQLETLRQARMAIKVPVVAIGGILPVNGAQLLEAGADLLAVIGGIFTSDPYQSTLAYHNLFK